ncbi:unnamed protein product, partial [Angiostrongylus costaricensis]|uniref:GPI ethanolamine phosphate transferase 3 n=1 Tax=Angiostrongylus costaricensis TaxID=334426 RepID=A0A0R3Q241_ANGCS
SHNGSTSKSPKNGDYTGVQNLYFAINTFLNFNVFASIGSLSANYIQMPSPRFLWIPVLLRILFIPFFIKLLPVCYSLALIYTPRYWEDSTVLVMSVITIMVLVRFRTNQTFHPFYQTCPGG